jgi:hypothetical protein
VNESPWSAPVRLSEIGRGEMRRTLSPDEGARAGIAEALGLDGLPEFTAEVELRPWMDGVELSASWRARVAQTCGVTLEPMETALAGTFEIRAVPEGSPHGPSDEGGEVVLDLDAPDPPDVLEGERIDPAAYLVEHLALEIDPFPRKPGAVFEPPEAEPEPSPFAALLELKPRS